MQNKKNKKVKIYKEQYRRTKNGEVYYEEIYITFVTDDGFQKYFIIERSPGAGVEDIKVLG